MKFQSSLYDGAESHWGRSPTFNAQADNINNYYYLNNSISRYVFNNNDIEDTQQIYNGAPCLQAHHTHADLPTIHKYRRAVYAKRFEFSPHFNTLNHSLYHPPITPSLHHSTSMHPVTHSYFHPSSHQFHHLPTTTFTKTPFYHRPTSSPSHNEAILIELTNASLWRKFHQVGTEMIITKNGRRMFPPLELSISNLETQASYAVIVDVVACDQFRYRYQNSRWMAISLEEEDEKLQGSLEEISWCAQNAPSLSEDPLKSPPMTKDYLNDFMSGWTNRGCYIHPDSPSTGSDWLKRSQNEGGVCFKKLKLTNSVAVEPGKIPLQSMRRYIPRVHVVLLSHGEGGGKGGKRVNEGKDKNKSEGNGEDKCERSESHCSLDDPDNVRNDGDDIGGWTFEGLRRNAVDNSCALTAKSCVETSNCCCSAASNYSTINQSHAVYQSTSIYGNLHNNTGTCAGDYCNNNKNHGNMPPTHYCFNNYTDNINNTHNPYNINNNNEYNNFNDNHSNIGHLLNIPNGPHIVKSVIFPETSFIAVTAYQNERITQLKIDNNPFARGFRETSAISKKPHKIIKRTKGNGTDAPKS